MDQTKNNKISLEVSISDYSPDALSSKTASLANGPNISFAKLMTEDVLPIPGGPVKMMLGRLPTWAIALSLCGLHKRIKNISN